MRYIMSGTFLAVLASSTFGATPFETEVPLQLTQALLRPTYGGTAMVYQDLPDDFAVFPLPAGFTVLGSADTGTALHAVLLPPPDAGDPQELVARQFEAQGWLRLTPTTPFNRDAGFVNARQASRPLMICSDDPYGHLSLSMVDTSEGQVLVLSDISRGNIGNQRMSCEFQAAMSQQQLSGRPDPDGLEDSMPRLEIPGGATRGQTPRIIRDEMAGSVRARQSAYSLNTDLSLAALQDHFGEQLVVQGWEPEQVAVGSFLINSTWTLARADGSRLRGILHLLRNSDRDRELVFWILAPED